MPEGRRFLLALGGVAACLAIAGGLVATTPPLVLPEPPAGPAHETARLPAPVPPPDAWHALAPRRPRLGPDAVAIAGLALPRARPLPSPAPAPDSGSIAAMAASPAGLEPVESFALPAAPPLPPAIQAPQVTPAPIVRGAGARHARAAVSAGLAAAGTHVGRSARTVGRTLKRVF